tara:strand:+ start:807 stop:1031 length:225 start_codon:yes stop_codon:yes gene_type:complete
LFALSLSRRPQADRFAAGSVTARTIVRSRFPAHSTPPQKKVPEIWDCSLFSSSAADTLAATLDRREAQANYCSV